MNAKRLMGSKNKSSQHNPGARRSQRGRDQGPGKLSHPFPTRKENEVDARLYNRLLSPESVGSMSQHPRVYF